MIYTEQHMIPPEQSLHLNCAGPFEQSGHSPRLLCASPRPSWWRTSSRKTGHWCWCHCSIFVWKHGKPREQGRLETHLHCRFPWEPSSVFTSVVFYRLSWEEILNPWGSQSRQRQWPLRLFLVSFLSLQVGLATSGSNVSDLSCLLWCVQFSLKLRCPKNKCLQQPYCCRWVGQNWTHQTLYYLLFFCEWFWEWLPGISTWLGEQRTMWAPGVLVKNWWSMEENDCLM